MKLGIIGSENTHSAAIAKMINVDKLIKGMAVTHIWGETPELARSTAEAGKVPNIVKDPSEMLGQVDCVMVDHRDGKYHIPAIKAFAKAGLPIFVDKPMSTSLAEAKSFVKFCQRNDVPLCTLSAMPHQDSFKQIKKEMAKLGKIRSIHTDGPGEFRSPYGGIWFYGIHQVDLMVEMAGFKARTVQMSTNGNDSMAMVNFEGDLTATMNFIAAGTRTFSVTIIGDAGTLHRAVTFDALPYLATTKLFTTMFKTRKEPFTAQRMLQPIAVLDAMEKSLATGRPAKIAKV